MRFDSNPFTFVEGFFTFYMYFYLVMVVTRIQRTYLLKNANRFKKKLLNWAEKEDTFLWLDSNNFKDKHTHIDALLAIGVEKECESNFPNALNTFETFNKDLNDWLFGYLSYDLKNEIEDLESNNPDDLEFPDLYFFQPKKLFIFSGKHLTLAYLKSYEDTIKKDFKSIRKTTPNNTNVEIRKNFKVVSRLSKAAYISKVESLLKHIKRGDIYETNFCQEFYVENAQLPLLSTYYNLNSISKPPFAGLLKFKDYVALSASPERYLKKQGNSVISQPIKGTAKRSKLPDEDASLKHSLHQDPKERSENIMIVDLVRNDLSKSAEKGSVEVEELCKVYSFKQVHQMISTIRATIANETSVVDLIRATFPMGSMTGAPKLSAMQLAEKYETRKRGLYSGAIGYITPYKDFDFNVVIRSILYNQSKKYVSFSVGGAITAKSNPEKEYEECMVKAKAMREVLEGNIK
ncbi:MAG: anthranilate synthase component I family protein [bacterium]